MELTLTVLGIAIAIVFGAIAYRQQRPGQQLAQRQLGENAKLKVIVNDSENDEIVWVLPWGKRKITFFTDFEISLINPNSQTIKDVIISVEMSNMLYPVDFPRKSNNAARLLKIEAVADPIDGKELTRITYSIDSIHPGVRVLIHDFIILSGPSKRRRTIPIMFKDGPGKVTYSYDLGYAVNISVIGQDVRPTIRNIGILSYDLNDELVKGVFLPPPLTEIADNLNAASKARPAWLLVVRKPGPAPSWLPTKFKRRFGVVRLSDAERHKVTRLPELGYLPLRLSRD